MNTNIALSRANRTIVGLLALVGMMTLPACATTYSALPIAAQVVDADSGEPLEDVIVVVKWEFDYIPPGISEHRGFGTFEFAEAVTNKNGEFMFPGWGPKAVPSDTPSRAFMSPNNPTIALFKPGYLYEVKNNPLQTAYLDDRNYIGDPVRHSTWNGKVIRLKRKSGDTSSYVARLQSPGGLPGGGSCNWERIPRMLSALIREGERLRAIHIANRIMTLRDIEEKASRGNCRTAQEVLGSFLK